MTEDEYARPHIDYLSLDLPSHHLTLGQVRRSFPDNELTVLIGEARRLDEVYMLEQDIVLLGYAGARGKEELKKACAHLYEGTTYDDEEGMALQRKHLQDYYIKYGIANGPESANQLVRRVEQMGADIARQQGIGPRG